MCECVGLYVSVCQSFVHRIRWCTWCVRVCVCACAQVESPVVYPERSVKGTPSEATVKGSCPNGKATLRVPVNSETRGLRGQTLNRHP